MVSSLQSMMLKMLEPLARYEGGDEPTNRRASRVLSPACLPPLVEKRYLMSLMFRIIMGFLMSVFLAFSMSLFAPIVIGSPVDWITVLMGTAMGTVIGTIVMAALPVIPLSMKFAVSCGAKEGSLSWFLLKDVLLCTIMLIILSFCLTLIGTGIDKLFVNRWLGTAPIMWAICYIIAIQVEPLCMLLACKITRTELSFGEAATEAEASARMQSPTYEQDA